MRKYTVEKRILGTGKNALKVLILRPTVNKRVREETPGLLWIHGGGYVIGNAGMIYISRALNLVKKYGAVVVTPAYRLAPKSPYPAALEDCYTALKYMRDHSEELGFNPGKIMVGGESSGGGLTAAVCMYARDRKEVNIAFQMPLYPMMDNRDVGTTHRNYGIDWITKNNRVAWDMYLGDVKSEPPVYAVPALQENYADLPPAYSFVGEYEAFYKETLAYIANLNKAGVPAHVDIYPTGLHGFDIVMPSSRVGREAVAAFEKEFLYAAEHYCTPQQEC